MKTKTLQANKHNCTYNGVVVLEVSGHKTHFIEMWAKENGYTHVKWNALPLGDSKPRLKIK